MAATNSTSRQYSGDSMAVLHPPIVLPICCDGVQRSCTLGVRRGAPRRAHAPAIRMVSWTECSTQESD